MSNQVQRSGESLTESRLRRLAGRGSTFQLATDIIETTMTPTWDDIGRVAAIAALRTMLTYFLDRDIETMGARLTSRAAEDSEGKRRTVA